MDIVDQTEHKDQTQAVNDVHNHLLRTLAQVRFLIVAAVRFADDRSQLVERIAECEEELRCLGGLEVVVVDTALYEYAVAQFPAVLDLKGQGQMVVRSILEVDVKLLGFENAQRISYEAFAVLKFVIVVDVNLKKLLIHFGLSVCLILIL